MNEQIDIFFRDFILCFFILPYVSVIFINYFLNNI